MSQIWEVLAILTDQLLYESAVVSSSELMLKLVCKQGHSNSRKKLQDNIVSLKSNYSVFLAIILDLKNRIFVRGLNGTLFHENNKK